MSEDNIGIHRPYQHLPEAEQPREDRSEDGQFAKAYGLGGQEVPVSSSLALAKVNGTPEGTKFCRVKVGSDGLLYDPYGLVTSTRRREGEADDFKRINEEGFTLYVKYLTTRNPLWLRHAQREVVNV